MSAHPSSPAKDWSGEHVFAAGYFAFRGRAADTAAHAHAALQLVAATVGQICLLGAQGERHIGPGFMVRPGAIHRLLPCETTVLLLIEPGAALLDENEPAEGGAIRPLPRPLLEAMIQSAPLEQVAGEVVALTGAAVLDVRLRAALGSLVQAQPGRIEALATALGLSADRLRSLARRELGVPLSKVASWRRVVVAAEAMADQESLADAALAAGFADQAHFTRTFRAMIGLTPGSAARSLRHAGAQDA
jgi:AraC-like DNA-binding protein